MKENVDARVAFPLTVRYEDGSEVTYADLEELERELEYFDSDSKPQCHVTDANGRSLRLRVEALELKTLEVASSSGQVGVTVADNQAGSRILLAAGATAVGAALALCAVSLLDGHLGTVPAKTALSLVVAVPFIADRIYLRRRRREPRGTEVS